MKLESEGQTALERELEDLITLAESSAARIDSLTAIQEQSRFRFHLFTFAVYGAILFVGFYAKDILPRDSSSLTKLNAAFASFVAFTGLIAFFLITSFYKETRRNRIISVDLRLEHEIHENLISLIDDQMRRMSYGRLFSPVAQAIYNIRIRRLSRPSDEYEKSRLKLGQNQLGGVDCSFSSTTKSSRRKVMSSARQAPAHAPPAGPPATNPENSASRG